MVAPILRGTIIGSALGILPGSGSILGSFAAYSIEKKVSKNRAQFGKGAIEGVAAPEVGQQRRRANVFYSLAYLGDSIKPGQRADGWSDDHPRDSTGTIGDQRTTGALLGHDRVDVDRKSFPGHPQLSADRHVGADDYDSLSILVSGNSGFLRYRCLQPQRIPNSTSTSWRCSASSAIFFPSSAASRRRCCLPSSSGR